MILEFKSVKKVYRGTPDVVALSDVSFGVEAGSLTAIVGPSGSGKTTLLNLASGLDQPSSGEILIHGQPIQNFSKSQLAKFRLQNLGYIFQAYNLFPTLNAVENVEYSLLMRGEAASVARQAAEKALEAVGLSAKTKAFPNQLSGGQQQRVAVARAIASAPKLIFADEPTANLDSKTAEQLIDLFFELNRTQKTTFVFSTHDLRLVNRVNRRLEMSDGVIQNDRRD